MKTAIILIITLFLSGCSSAKLMKNCEHLGKSIYKCEDI